MVEISLECAIVGQPGTFDVTIDDGKKVSVLKDAIKDKKANKLKGIDAGDLQLFLAKADGAWLQNEDPCVPELEEGRIHPDVQTLIDGDKMTSNWTIKNVLDENQLPTPRSKQVHVLVVVPQREERSSDLPAAEDSEVVTVKEYVEADERDETRTDTREIRAVLAELELYRRRGQVILEECSVYCAEILDEIDTLYCSSTAGPLPFICVEGSSGMGKSQLAFALKRRRPWFYWLVSPVGFGSQKLYRNFESVSAEFRRFMMRDFDSFGRTELVEKEPLNTFSLVYQKKKLWTYGFIRALLEYCRLQDAKMIRFDKATKFTVSKCNRKAIVDVCNTLEKDKLPFFILDEMTSSANGGEMLAAFQRNVFRACGLVVIVMGTDTKISNLVGQSVGSYSVKHMWMSVVPRFPPYQVVHHTTKDEEAWEKLVKKFSVLKAIAKASRGRFARYFVEEVLSYADRHSTVELGALLDETFSRVFYRTQEGKHFMREQDGKYAQLMAISYTNAADCAYSSPSSAATDSPPQKKRKLDLGTRSMHLHFANLVDKHLTKVMLSDKKLQLASGSGWEPLCSFPEIHEDLLLYLAILGGKTYAAYYDSEAQKTYSTKTMFWENMKGKGFSVNENTQACSNDYKTFENMIAHAIFCASRRNGVQGICFNEFFGWLLGELRDELTEVELTLDSESIRASDLFDGYPLEMSNVVIPFLAPPNARWPKCILELNAGSGCNFGHLVRPPNIDRCDVYVEGEEEDSALLVCECKYWEKNVDIRAMRRIITGLNAAWKGPPDWKFAIVFCVNMANIQTWEETKIGCVKINSQNGCVEWKFQPEEKENREKLVIVVETGGIRPALSGTMRSTSSLVS